MQAEDDVMVVIMSNGKLEIVQKADIQSRSTAVQQVLQRTPLGGISLSLYDVPAGGVSQRKFSGANTIREHTAGVCCGFCLLPDSNSGNTQLLFYIL